MKIKEDRVGKEGHCPKCKAAFIVPAADTPPTETAPEPDAAAAPAAAASQDEDFDPVAFLMTDGPGDAQPRQSGKAAAGDAPDLRVKRDRAAADYTESEEPDVRVGGPRTAPAADDEEVEAQLRMRKPKRAAAPSASKSADEMLRVNAAASSAKDLMTKTVEESRIRAAQMPEEKKEPGVDYEATAKELLLRFAPAVTGAVALIVLAFWFGNLLVGPDVALPDLGQVSGIVTKGGEPLVDARVDFYQVDPVDPEKTGTASGYTDEKGFYELKYLEGVKGAAVGRNRVQVYLVGPDGREVIPPQSRYGKGSKEIVVVEEGSQTIDIEIP